MLELIRRGRTALLAVVVCALSVHPVLAQGLVAPDAVHETRFGSQYLWSPGGVVCIAGCNGVAEPIRLGAGTEHPVLVQNFDFTPQLLDVTAGDSVTWTNVSGTHNVRADDDSFRCANGCDGDGGGGNGDPASNAWMVTLTFPDPATVPYYCEAHGNTGGVGMFGVITVAPLVIFEDGFETGDTSGWSASTG